MYSLNASGARDSKVKSVKAMAAISESIAPAAFQENLRPFDIRRDLGEVADLVELCFAETLDPDGREYLARMRSAANSTSLVTMAKGWASAPMSGYVWQEAGHIVGNVSLIPYLLQGRRCFLIANVAVHPDFRRHGIGRRLTEKAIESARKKRAPAVWLHVRAENRAARDLYLSLDFQEQAIRTTWVGNPDYAPPENTPGIHFIAPRDHHWSAIRGWLRRSYPEELSWHSSFRLNNLRPGLIGIIYRFLHSAYVHQWGAVQRGRLVACAAWQATGAYANAVWLAAPAKNEDEAVRRLLLYVRRHSPTRRTLALEYPAGQYVGAIQEAGFKEQQTLVWMALNLA